MEAAAPIAKAACIGHDFIWKAVSASEVVVISVGDVRFDDWVEVAVALRVVVVL